MICPNCKCEYLAGVTQCSDCGVPLVDTLGPEIPSTPDDGGMVHIWSGDDPRKFALVKEALETANIPYMGPGPTGSIILPSMNTKLEIGVSVADRDRAQRVLFDLGGSTDHDELTSEEREKLALPESDVVDQDDTASDLLEDWDEDAPVAEVWNGEQEDFAKILSACLRENNLASRRIGAGGRWRLVVATEHEARAREIVREVVEASPPV